MASTKCGQCGRQAVVGAADGQAPLCVDHYFTYVKIAYLQATMAASHYNVINQRLHQSTGGLLPLSQIVLPQPSFLQEGPTFNTMKIDNSVIGVLNTGTMSNLRDVDFTVEVMNSQGQSELAKSISELTQAVMNSIDISKEHKEDISQQLKFIAMQLTEKPDARQKGLVKAVLSQIRTNVGTVAALVTILDKVEPIVRQALGI